jgi:hypothetical protein
MEMFEVWFRNNRAGTTLRIAAASRTKAIAMFADRHGVMPSSYIAAKRIS